jgi:hypothetical protein
MLDDLIAIAHRDAAKSNGPDVIGSEINDSLQFTCVVAHYLGQEKGGPFGAIKMYAGLPYGPDVGRRGRGDRVQVVLVRLRVPIGRRYDREDGGGRGLEICGCLRVDDGGTENHSRKDSHERARLFPLAHLLD